MKARTQRKTSAATRGIRAIYPGSFDPVTNGHLDIIDRALEIFDEVTVLVAGTVRKDPLFTPPERVEILEEVLRSRPRAKVDLWDGLMMDYARNTGIPVVVRGLRAASDFEYEFMMASMNKQLNPEVETLFMMSSQEAYFVSSTMVKELFQYGGDIGPYVPKEALRWLRSKKGRRS